MSKSIQYINKERIPKEQALLLPGRLDLQGMMEFEKQLVGRKIIWVCEESVVLTPAAENFLTRSHGEAVSFSANDNNLKEVGQKLAKDLGAEGIAVFIPGEVTALNGTSVHITSKILNALCELNLPT